MNILGYEYMAVTADDNAGLDVAIARLREKGWCTYPDGEGPDRPGEGMWTMMRRPRMLRRTERAALMALGAALTASAILWAGMPEWVQIVGLVASTAALAYSVTMMRRGGRR